MSLHFAFFSYYAVVSPYPATINSSFATVCVAADTAAAVACAAAADVAAEYCPIAAAVIVSKTSTYRDANDACSDADVVPNAYEDALNGETKMLNVACHFAPVRMCCGW